MASIRKSIAMIIQSLLISSCGHAAEPLQPSAPTPRVAVEYVHPERFIDVGDRYSPASGLYAALLADLSNHLVVRASALLPEGLSVSIVIFQVDRAGSVEPFRLRAGQIRVVRSVTPARIDLSYRLVGTDGSVVGQGERSLREFPSILATIAYRGDPLRREKLLLDTWIEREFESL